MFFVFLFAGIKCRADDVCGWDGCRFSICNVMERFTQKYFAFPVFVFFFFFRFVCLSAYLTGMRWSGAALRNVLLKLLLHPYVFVSVFRRYLFLLGVTLCRENLYGYHHSTIKRFKYNLSARFVNCVRSGAARGGASTVWYFVFLLGQNWLTDIFRCIKNTFLIDWTIMNKISYCWIHEWVVIVINF